MEGKIQTTIDTSPDTISSHAPHQVEENMPENHSTRRSKPHALSETRVSAETDGVSGDAPTVKRRKKIKNWLITGTPPPSQQCFLSFSRDKMIIVLFNEILKKNKPARRTGTDRKCAITVEPLNPDAVFCLFRGANSLLHCS